MNPTGLLKSYVRHLRARQFARVHLQHHQFDLAISPRWGVDGYHHAHIAHFSGARHRIGFSESSFPLKQQWNRHYDLLFTRAIPGGEVQHEVLQNLSVLSALGGTIEDNRLELWLDDADHSAAASLMSERITGPLVALAPGAGHPKREWPVSRFAELARILATEYGAQIVLAGGPSDTDAAQELQHSLQPHNVINAVGCLTLRQTAALFARCDLLVGNDSGPMHLAAAMGVPVVALSCHPRTGDRWSDNSPERFGPWGVKHVVLQPAATAAPCIGGCTSHHAHCIRGIGVDDTARAAGSFLSHSDPRTAQEGSMAQ